MEGSWPRSTSQISQVLDSVGVTPGQCTPSARGNEPFWDWNPSRRAAETNWMCETRFGKKADCNWQGPPEGVPRCNGGKSADADRYVDERSLCRQRICPYGQTAKHAAQPAAQPVVQVGKTAGVVIVVE